jgi:hypothetical protein
MLSIGILMAGSLYWSREPYRVAWRSKFLNMDQVIPVRAPIRYGRKSRHGSYTMVFAPGGPMGQAKVVACQSHATSIVDILSQAKALWLAERPPDALPAPGQRLGWPCSSGGSVAGSLCSSSADQSGAILIATANGAGSPCDATGPRLPASPALSSRYQLIFD